jgi:hypothetical protein
MTNNKKSQSKTSISAIAHVISDKHSNEFNVDANDNWQLNGQFYIEYVQSIIAAAPVPVKLDPKCCGDAGNCPVDYSTCPHRGKPPNTI